MNVAIKLKLSRPEKYICISSVLTIRAQKSKPYFWVYLHFTSYVLIDWNRNSPGFTFSRFCPSHLLLFLFYFFVFISLILLFSLWCCSSVLLLSLIGLYLPRVVLLFLFLFLKLSLVVLSAPLFGLCVNFTPSSERDSSLSIIHPVWCRLAALSESNNTPILKA